MENYQTIAVFTYASEYTVLRHLLQQADLNFIFQNETTLGVLPFHSLAIGGIRLMVHNSDVDRAREILNSLNPDYDLRIV